MRTSRSVLLAATIICAFALASPPKVEGSPIYSATGTAEYGIGNSPVAISWTQAETWTNVDVSLTLLNLCAEFLFNFCNGTSAASGDVYLTNAIGAGTTAAANQLAFTTLNTSGIVFPTVTAFSDLTLEAGTYYLVFVRTTLAGLLWAGGIPDYEVLVAPGVTAGPNYLVFGGSIVSGYAPSTPLFVEYSGFLTPLFSITGDPASVPEPTSLSLLGIGLAIAARVRRRSRRM